MSTFLVKILNRVSGGDPPGRDIHSLVRIVIYAVAFLWLIGLVIPQKSVDTPHSEDEFSDAIVDMTAAYGDPRGFNLDVPERKPEEFRIAWIGGSSSTIFRPGKPDDLLPRRVIRHLPPVESEDVVVLSYILHAQRLYDSYLCLLDALKHEPDVIVLTIHYNWSFDSRSLLHRKNLLRSGALRQPLSLNTIKEYVLISDPTDWAGAVLSKVFKVVRDQADIHEYSKRTAEALYFGTAKKGEAFNQIVAFNKKHQVDNYTPHQSVYFWNAYKEYSKPLSKLVDVEASRLSKYNTWGTINERIINQMYQVIRDSEIPTLIYMSPGREKELSNRTVAGYVSERTKLMRKAADQFESPRIKTIENMPRQWQQDLVFQDYMHLIDPSLDEEGSADLPYFLASEIWRLGAYKKKSEINADILAETETLFDKFQNKRNQQIERRANRIQRDLILNGDFEHWASGFPTNWEVRGKSIDQVKEMDGRSMLLEIPGNNEEGITLRQTFVSPDIPNAEYRISIDAKTSDKNKIVLYAYYKIDGELNRNSLVHPGNDEWITLEFDVKVPEEADPEIIFMIGVRGGAKQPTYFDNAKLIRFNEATPEE